MRRNAAMEKADEEQRAAQAQAESPKESQTSEREAAVREEESAKKRGALADADISASMQLRDAELSAMMMASSSFDATEAPQPTVFARVQEEPEEDEEELEGSREHVAVGVGLPAAFTSPGAETVGTDSSFGGSGRSGDEGDLLTDEWERAQAERVRQQRAAASAAGAGSERAEKGDGGGQRESGLAAARRALAESEAEDVQEEDEGEEERATQLIGAQAEIDVLRSDLGLPPSPARASSLLLVFLFFLVLFLLLAVFHSLKMFALVCRGGSGASGGVILAASELKRPRTPHSRRR